MRARVRDTEIYFEVAGLGLVAEGGRMRDKPTAFVIHGGPGSEHTDLTGPFAPLASAIELVYFDHRGQGRSARGDPKRYNLDENVEDMEALREYLGIGPIVSIGTSYGGMVAMAHAARHPASVAALVLIVTASHSGFIGRAKDIVAERGTPEQRAVTEELWAGRLDTAAAMRRYYELMGPLYSRTHDPERAKASLDRRIFSPEALNRAFAPGGFMYTLDLRPELGNITAPTLVIAGRHDWICPPEFSEEIHRLIPGSELRIFEDSSHSVRSDEPERLIEAISGFVSGVGAFQTSSSRRASPSNDH
jgi:proline iminopeptidase